MSEGSIFTMESPPEQQLFPEALRKTERTPNTTPIAIIKPIIIFTAIANRLVNFSDSDRLSKKTGPVRLWRTQQTL